MYTNRDMRNAMLGAVVAIIAAYFIFGQKNGKKEKEGGGGRCGCDY